MRNLSVAILQLSESVELDYFRSKWWASSCVAKNDKSAPLKLTSLKGIFLLLALGLRLGLFLALMELAAKSRKIANTQQVGPIYKNRVHFPSTVCDRSKCVLVTI